MNSAEQRPLQVIAPRKDKMFQAPAVLGYYPSRSSEAVATSALKIFCRDVSRFTRRWMLRVQQIANEALERGLELYEKRHPGAKGIIQGSVVVLRETAMRAFSPRLAVVSSTRTAPPHTATLTVSPIPAATWVNDETYGLSCGVSTG